MKQISSFKGAPNKLGNVPQYALYVTKYGAWEIHKWTISKRYPKGHWAFFRATGTIENTAERILTLATGDSLATRFDDLIDAWNKTKQVVIKTLKGSDGT